jgi:hypothetical protein
MAADRAMRAPRPTLRVQQIDNPAAGNGTRPARGPAARRQGPVWGVARRRHCPGHACRAAAFYFSLAEPGQRSSASRPIARNCIRISGHRAACGGIDQEACALFPGRAETGALASNRRALERAVGRDAIPHLSELHLHLRARKPNIRQATESTDAAWETASAFGPPAARFLAAAPASEPLLSPCRL